jgi:hypothetical protein
MVVAKILPSPAHFPTKIKKLVAQPKITQKILRSSVPNLSLRVAALSASKKIIKTGRR